MKSLSTRAACLLLAAALAIPGLAKDDTVLTRAVEAYGKLPLQFEINQGQTDGRVKFLTRSNGYRLFLTQDEAVFAMRGEKDRRESTLRMKVEGANQHATVAGAAQLPGVVNYLTGKDRSAWRTNIPAFEKVRYTGIYPGIDLTYYGNQRQLEYDFTVSPGADPKIVRLKLEGASVVQIAEDGDLVAAVGKREVRFARPVAYQLLPERRANVSTSFVVDGDEVRFAVGNYDKSLPLVIDPLLEYSTYLGGFTDDSIAAIAIDKAGDAFVTGQTRSPDFPVTPGAADTTCDTQGGSTCVNNYAFVSELNPTGTALIYSTYIGSNPNPNNAYSLARAIKVDAGGNAYIAGETSDPNFPGGNPNISGFTPWGFVLKLNSTGSNVVYSHVIGGNGYTGAFGLDLDAAGEAYFVGSTNATVYTAPNAFPTTANAFMPEGFPGQQAGNFQFAFFTKLSADGSSLLYSTLFGDPGVPQNSYGISVGLAVAVDTTGAAYLTGYTMGAHFPVSTNALQTTCTPEPNTPGICDSNKGFVAKLDPSQSGNASLIYSTYLAGSAMALGNSPGDYLAAIAVNNAGQAYVTGFATSPDYPTTSSAYEKSCPSSGNPPVCTTGVVSELDATGSALVFSTFLSNAGSGSSTVLNGIALDSRHQVYVTGYTGFSDYPTVNPIQGYAGGNDAVVTALNSTGSALIFSTFLGGSSNEQGNGISIDSRGQMYVGGWTLSSDFPVTAGAFQTTHGPGNQQDGFVSKIALTAADLAVTVSGNPNPVHSGSVLTMSVVVTNNGPDAANPVSVTNPVPGGTLFASVSSTAGTCTSPPVGKTGTVICSGFRLASGHSATVRIGLTVKAHAGATITDKAQTTTASPDPNAANNTATTTVSVD